MKKKTRAWPVVLFSLCIAWLFSRIVRDSLMDVARVTNESMLPYLAPGTRLVISRLSPCAHLPLSGKAIFCRPCEPGQAYVFWDPQQPQRRLVKFAIAKEEFTKGSARVASGDIISFTPRAPKAAFPVEQAMLETPLCYFIGSNSDNSVDSRDFGPVAAENVAGKVIYPILRTRDSR